MEKIKELNRVHRDIKSCSRCSQMCGTPVHGPAIDTQIYLLGQAPGPHEADRGKPFAHTAGRTLFNWFSDTAGIDEAMFRDHIYMSAVARCFPGKGRNQKSGDREPSIEEIENCRPHIIREIEVIKPRLILPVGRLAMSEVLGKEIVNKNTQLVDLVGQKFKTRFHNFEMDVIPLPHPSGVSPWPRIEPGKSKLQQALQLIRRHPVWKEVFNA